MQITIVNYHYVRPLPDKTYPELKAFSLSEFEERIDYYRNNFSFVCPNNLIEIIKNGKKLENLIWLTFDDGLTDHYDYVFPILRKFDIPATFFPSAQPIIKGVILPVHKIHLILSRGWPIKKLLLMLEQSCKENNFSSQNLQNLIETKDFNSRFDDLQTSIFKKLLQKFLPAQLRLTVLNDLFEKVLDDSEDKLSRKFYLQREQINEMLENNLSIGGHGGEHLWLGNSTKAEQIKEIRESAALLNSFKQVKTRIFSYPYGSYSQETIKILKKFSFDIGLTTISNKAVLNQNNLMELNRFDANDHH
jgi:peptidoglycan/xylan/chitin deacetylase (PgdA/CDA1 family)